MNSVLDVYLKHQSVMENYFRRLDFPEGATIFSAGDEGDSAFIIEDGEVVISRRVKGRDKALAVIGKGETLGEVALFSGVPRTATARSSTALKCLELSRAGLQRLRADHADLAYDVLEAVLGIVARRLHATTERYEVVYFWLS